MGNIPKIQTIIQPSKTYKDGGGFKSVLGHFGMFGQYSKHPNHNSTRMGRLVRYLGIESILLKYRDEILKPPLRLSTYIMEGRVKILETYPKSEEIISFYPHIFIHLQTFCETLRRTAMFWLRHFIT